MLVRPMEVYKYKSVSTRQDFERLRDIISITIFICRRL